MSIFTTALVFKEDAFRDIAKIAILFSMVLLVRISWLNFIIAERKLAKVADAIKQAAPVPVSPDIAIG